MGIWPSVAKERSQLDGFKGSWGDLQSEVAERCQDFQVCQERHFERLETVLELHREALQRIEDVMYEIQQRLNSQVVSSIGSVTDNDNRDHNPMKQLTAKSKTRLTRAFST